MQNKYYQTISKESNRRYNNTTDEYNSSKSVINSQFQQIYDILKSTQLELISKLDISKNENDKLYNEIKQDINQLNNDNQQSIKDKLYNYSSYSIKPISTNQLTQSIQSLFKIKSTNNNYEKIITLNDNEQYKNYDGFEDDDEDEGEEGINNLILSGNFSGDEQIVIPSNIDNLILKNGFNIVSPGQLVIPDTVKYLSIHNIEFELTNQSIPPTIEFLYIGKRYKYSITSEIIPSTIKHIQFGELVQPLHVNSIPNGIPEITLSNGFNQLLNEHMVPVSVTTVNLCDIGIPLTSISLPASIKELHLQDEFNQILTSDSIPSTIESLYIYNIKSKLEIGSIPESIKELHLQDELNQILTNDIIPSTIESLYIYNVNCIINGNMLPVGTLHLCDGFGSHQSEFNIPSSITCLHLYDIALQLKPGDIPSSIQELHIHDGFSQRLTNGIIPSTIKYLFIYNITSKLEIGSIPGTSDDDDTKIIQIKELHLCNGFSQPIYSNLLPTSKIDKLFINDIEYFIN